MEKGTEKIINFVKRKNEISNRQKLLKMASTLVTEYIQEDPIYAVRSPEEFDSSQFVSSYRFMDKINPNSYPSYDIFLIYASEQAEKFRLLANLDLISFPCALIAVHPPIHASSDTPALRAKLNSSDMLVEINDTYLLHEKGQLKITTATTVDPLKIRGDISNLPTFIFKNPSEITIHSDVPLSEINNIFKKIKQSYIGMKIRIKTN